MPKQDRLVSMAQRLINNNGRQITLVQFSDTPTDTSRPWKGRDEDDDIKVQMIGVFVPPNTVRQFGLLSLGAGTEWMDMIAKSEQIVIVSQGEIDLQEFTQVIDGTTKWGVLASQVLRPADRNLLGFIGVRR